MKKKKIGRSSHQKAIDRMNSETKRAISRVGFLEKLYNEMQKSKVEC